MELTFKNNYNKIRVIGNYENVKEVKQAISDFLDSHNYQSYYWRYVGLSENNTMIDVGSHTEFFYVDTDVNNLIDKGHNE